MGKWGGGGLFVTSFLHTDFLFPPATKLHRNRMVINQLRIISWSNGRGQNAKSFDNQAVRCTPWGSDIRFGLRALACVYIYNPPTKHYSTIFQIGSNRGYLDAV